LGHHLAASGRELVQNGRAPRPVTNVRDDKILASRFWRSSFEERRCLVPATSFCEPNGDVKPATWHWFSLKGTEPRPLFAFPGIWRKFLRRRRTRSSGRSITMPVLLTHEEEFDIWLRGSAEDAFALAGEYPPA
jgi:putative SOS response-associated peptidase YedK